MLLMLKIIASSGRSLIKRPSLVSAGIAKALHTSAIMSARRAVVKTVLSVERPEGAGAVVRRSIGGPGLRNFDPFLLFDEGKAEAPAGFPDHPHRGFETVSYVLKGKTKHEDFCGHKGVLGPGDVQWMTAGRGIVHSEMPAGTGEVHALQLWVNLRSDMKMCEPTYQELSSKQIPKPNKNGVKIAVISGEALGAKSKIYTRTPTMYLDFKLKPGAKHDQPVPSGWNAFVYTLSGVTDVSGTDVLPHTTAVLGEGDFVTVENRTEEKTRFLLIAGQPLNEPVVHRGPFVMNTEEQINEAMADYGAARNGFENVKTWRKS